MSKSPTPKRIRLDPSPSPSPPPKCSVKGKSRENGEADTTRASVASMDADADDDEDHCVICLQRIQDRTILPCAHDRMCFECILVWAGQSRKCPLCNSPIGPYLIHNIRSNYDYQKRYLPPLKTSPPLTPPLAPLRGGSGARSRAHTNSERWGSRPGRISASRERKDMEDELELAIQRRKRVYRHHTYAKHVASNSFTRYRPAPTPAQVAASPDIISRATIFIRRELRVWVNLDVEFLTTFILSLMKSLDLRSESAVKLLAEFLDMDTPYHVGAPSESTGRFPNAEHFAHELYSYLRSPYRELATYDASVQYDFSENVSPAPPRLPIEPRKWEIRSPVPAESSTRRRARNSPPSQLPDSPRDQSRSTMYLNPQEEHIRYDDDISRRFSGSVRSPRNSQSDATNHRRKNEYANRDRKGKSKEVASPRLDLLQNDSVLNRYATNGQTRKDRGSPARAFASKIDEADEHPNDRPPTDTPSLLRHCSDSTPDGGEGGANVPSTSKTSPHKRSEVDEPPSDSPHSNKKQPASVHMASAKIDTTWGISIKGQAKFLKQIQDYGDLDRIDGDHTPALEEGPAKSAGPHMRNDTVLEDTYVSHRDDHALSSLPPSKPSNVNDKSAPEMGLRAKLTRLDHQPSVVDETFASSAKGGAGEETLNMRLRARILERLEEEKRQAAARQRDGGSSMSFNHTDDSERIAPGVANGEKKRTLDSIQAESMLKMRLAAERASRRGH